MFVNEGHVIPKNKDNILRFLVNGKSLVQTAVPQSDRGLCSICYGMFCGD